MSNPFLNPISGGAGVNTSNGTLNANISSLVVSDLLANKPVKTDNSKKLVSGQISLSDCSFSPITNPYTGTLSATVDVQGGGVSLISRAPKDSPVFTTSVTFPLNTAGYVKTSSGGVISSSATVPYTDITTGFLLLSGGSLSGGLNMGSNSISNVNDISCTTLTVGSTTGYLKRTAGVVSSVAQVPFTDITTGFVLKTGDSISGTLYIQVILPVGGNDTGTIGNIGNQIGAICVKTLYLNSVDISTTLGAKANANNAVFTGSITTPLSTGYVKSTAGVLSSSSTIPYTDVTAGFLETSGGSLTGNVNTLSLIPASIAANIGTALSPYNEIRGNSFYVNGSDLSSLLSLKAPLASPSFSGTITTPLASGILKSSSGVLSSASQISQSEVYGLTSELQEPKYYSNAGFVRANYTVLPLQTVETHSSGNIGNTIYLNSQKYSTDGGVTWQTSLLTAGYVVSPWGPGYGVALKLSGSGQALYTTDGVTWLGSGYTVSMTFDLSQNIQWIWTGVNFLIGESNYIHLSAAGFVWSQITLPRIVKGIVHCGGGRVVTTGPDGAMYSTDHGQTWFPGTVFNGFQVSYGNQVLLSYEANFGSSLVWYSTDLGINWSSVNCGYSLSTYYVGQYFDPVSSLHYFVGNNVGLQSIISTYNHLSKFCGGLTTFASGGFPFHNRVYGDLFLISNQGGVKVVTAFRNNPTAGFTGDVVSMNGALISTSNGVKTKNMNFDMTANTISSTSGTITLSTTNQQINLNAGSAVVNIPGSLTVNSRRFYINLNGAQALTLTAGSSRTLPLAVNNIYSNAFTVNTGTGAITYNGATSYYLLTFNFIGTFSSNGGNSTILLFGPNLTNLVGYTSLNGLNTAAPVGGNGEVILSLVNNQVLQFSGLVTQTTETITFSTFQMAAVSLFL